MSKKTKTESDATPAPVRIYRLKVQPQAAPGTLTPQRKDLMEAYCRARTMAARASELEDAVLQAMLESGLKEVDFGELGKLRTRQVTSAKSPTREEAEAQVHAINVALSEIAELQPWEAAIPDGWLGLPDSAPLPDWAWDWDFQGTLSAYLAEKKESLEAGLALWQRFLVYLADKKIMEDNLRWFKDAGLVIAESSTGLAYYQTSK